MATDNHTNKFSAADIERYHQGKLSAREMHQLEKAALDDPFLADALEGYATPGVNLAGDMAELQKRLAERTEEKKVIPLAPTGRRRLPLLRIAAMIIVLAGAAYLITQVTFNRKNDEIVSADPVQKKNQPNTDSGRQVPAEKITEPSGNATTAPVIDEAKGRQPATITPRPVTAKEEKLIQQETPKILDRETYNPEVASVPARKKEIEVYNDMLAQKDNNKEVPAKTAEISLEKDSTAAKAKQANAGGRDYAKRLDNSSTRNQVMNTFRGRVTDRANIGVPFANVTNIQDNAGTYADANGYFNFRSPDTALNVQVRSIGFENKITELRRSVPTNQVVLADDRSLNEVVISNQRPNSEARANRSTRTMEEPEPADGWTNYDAYLANNLVAPDDYETKQVANASVEVSFEVDKHGEPVNFRVERSLCNKCDQEAIRLIKEGPKWKQNANRKGRTTVTINF